MLALANKLTNSTQPIYRFVNKYSIDFDGVDDVIVTDGADTVVQPTTYAFWCKSSTTTENFGVFGHGGVSVGAFHLNSNDLYPMLYLGSNYWIKWNENSAQDDGEWHHYVVYLTTNLIDSKLYCDGVLQTKNTTLSSGSLNAYTESLSIGGDKASGGNYFEGQIDEFAVFDRELKQDEITRMYNTYYTPNRVANGNFSQEGVEEVSNGDFSEIGSELVTNGDFASNSDWTDVNNVSTITNGQLVFNNNTLGGKFQSTSMVVGKIYKLVYTIVSISNGYIQPRLGDTGLSTQRTSAGTYTEYITCAGDTILRVYGSTTNGIIDNISVKEVGIDWSFNGWNMGDNNQAVLAGTGQGNNLFQQALTQNDSYEAIIDVVVTQGSVRVMLGGGSGGYNQIGEATSTGIYTYYGKSSGSGNIILLQSGNNSIPNSVKINSIKIKEVGQNWTLIGTATISDGKAHINSPSGELAEIIQTGSLVIGRNYKLNCDLDKTSGDTQFVNGGTFILVDGLNTINFTATTTNVYFKRGAGSVVSSLDNVVVQELKSDATNLMLNAGAYQSANPLITSTNSMEFDGADDYLVSESPTIGTEFTVSAWINTSDISGSSGSYRAFFATGGYGSGTTFKIGIRDDNGKIEIWQGNAAKGTGTSNVGDGKWHLITYTKNSTQAKIYVDGVLETTTAYTTTLTFPYIYVGLGGSNSPIPDNGGYFNGLVTEFGVYDRTLTPLEIASLYNQGMPTNLLVNRNDYQSGNPTVFNTKQVDFDGADDYLQLGNFNNLGTSDCSFSFWVNLDSATNVTFAGKFQDNSNRVIFYTNGANQIATQGRVGGNYAWNFTGTGTPVLLTPYLNKWTHIAFCIDRSANLLIFINGELKSTTSISSTASTNVDNTGNWFFGQSNGSFLNGQMSQSGMWNKALTANEVSSLYNHGLPVDLNTNQAAYTSSSNLVGYWRMGSGTLDAYPLIADQTNATLGNSIWDGASGSETGWANFGNNTHQTVGDALLITYVNSSSGVYIYLRDSSQLSTDLTVGKAYEISFDTKVTSGAVIWQTQNTTSYFANQTSSTSYINQKFTIVATSATDVFLFPRQINSAASVFIKNIKVQEVQGNPAIMTNMTASDIENGSPYANVVQNGTFDTDSDWTKGTGVTISGGKANWTNTANNVGITQNDIITSGKNYKVVFTVFNYSSGSVRVRFPQITDRVTSNGTYTYYINATSTNLFLQGETNGDANVNFSIDNITVSEVNTGLQGYWKMGDGINDEYPIIYDQTNPTLSSELVTNGDFATDSNWTKGTGWSIANGKATTDGTINTDIEQNFTETGKTYYYSVTYSASDTFSSRIRSGATGAIINIQEAGTYNGYFIANGVEFEIVTLSDNTISYSIDNVSVKEVQGNPATMTNMVEGNITNQYPLTKIRNYWRMGDGILDGYPIIQDQTSPNLAHIPTTNLVTYSEDFSQWNLIGVSSTYGFLSPNGTNTATKLTSLNTDPYIFKSAPSPNGTIYSSSIYIKGIGNTIGNTARLWIIKDNVDYLNEDFTITNEWQRISTSKTNYTPVVNFVTIRLDAPDINPQIGDEVFVWAGQLEQQSQATAYLKSDGIAAVRKATTTNLITYSEDFSGYNKSNYAILENQIDSPFGILNATKIIPNSASGVNKFMLKSVAGLSNSTAYSLSIFAKAGEFDKFRIEQGDNSRGAWFDLTNGTVVSSNSDFGENITLISDGWYRCEVTSNTVSTSMAFVIAASDTTNFQSGNSVKGVYVIGSQVEEQTQAETYAKTTGLPVTIDLFTENNYGTMTNMVAGDIVLDTPNNPA